MAAIYRFGFENKLVPDGVILSSGTYGTGRYGGTSLRSGSTGYVTNYGVTTEVFYPAATTGLSVTVPVTGSSAFASYFCWLTGVTPVFSADQDYTVASFGGNSVGFSNNSLWIKTAGGVEQRVSKDELSGTYMEVGSTYYATVEFQLGTSGHISLYWDGLTVSYDGDTGSIVSPLSLALYCPSFTNKATQIEHSDHSVETVYSNGFGFMDDIAINDGSGNLDIGIPGPVACFSASAINAVSNTGWTPTALDDIDTALSSGTGISAATSGSRVVLGYACNPQITKSGFEGINVFCQGMSKTGSGKIGMRYGAYEAGSYYQKSADLNLGYAAVNGSFSILYSKNSASTDPNNLLKFSVADGEALGTYFEVI